MSANICGIIVPRYQEIVGERRDGYLPQCVLARDHRGPHVFRTPEGELVAWEDDWNCGCCSPEEDDRCYVYWPVTREDIPDSADQQT